MKKLLAVMALLWAGNVSAQITLDKTFDGPTSLIKISPTDYRIVVTEPDSSFSIYTLSYTLEKHITPPKVKGKMPIGVSYVSSSLFATDSKYEFIALYVGSPYSFYIYNEDGNTIFQSADPLRWLNNTSSGTKMGAGKNVYSLPGSNYVATIPVQKDSIDNIQVYPNPSNAEIRIQGNYNGTLLITNSNGVQVTAMPYKDGLLINTNHFASGVYVVSIYSNNAVYSSKFEVVH